MLGPTSRAPRAAVLPLLAALSYRPLPELRVGMVQLAKLLVVAGDDGTTRDRDLYFRHLAERLPDLVLGTSLMSDDALCSDRPPLHIVLLAPTYGALIVGLNLPADGPPKETGANDMGGCCVRMANAVLPLSLQERMRPLDMEPAVVSMQALLLDRHGRRLERLVMTTSRERVLTETLRTARSLAKETQALGHDTSLLEMLLDSSVPSCLRAPSPSDVLGSVEPPSVASIRPTQAVNHLAASCGRPVDAKAVRSCRKLKFAQRLPLDKKSELVNVLILAERQARDIVVLRVRQTMPPTFTRCVFEDGIEMAHEQSNFWSTPCEWMDVCEDDVLLCHKAYFKLVDREELFSPDFLVH